MKKNLHQRKPRKAVKRKPVKVVKKKAAFATWKELHKTYLQLASVLEAALESRFIATNPAIIDPLTNEQRIALTGKLTQVLDGVKEYSVRLDDIYNKHKHLISTKDTPEAMFDMLAISNEYQTWLNDWTDNVANTVLLDVLNYANNTTFTELTIEPTI